MDEATVDKWRASEEAKQQPGRLQKLLDEGGVRDFQLVAEVGFCRLRRRLGDILVTNLAPAEGPCA